MADNEHIEILKQGTQVWNQWRKDNPAIQPDLMAAHLSSMDLVGINLSGANLANIYLFAMNLTGANLSGSNLLRAELDNVNLNAANLSYTFLMDSKLTGVHLNNADLSHTKLTRAQFVGTGLHAANLTDSNLLFANFGDSDLTEADFTAAWIGWTTFGENDLSKVKGLDLVWHSGPSPVSILTMYRSVGNIPERFLRGAGIPDNFITYMSSLVGKAFDYYSCFISYSTKDQPFADRLYSDLQSKGIRCWLATKDLKIGDRTGVGIEEAIRKHDKLLLILSNHSIKSDWVEKEVEAAMELERRQKQTILFPIRLDNAVMKVESGWSADIRRTRNMGDFRRWKSHDTYQNAFDRLLHDLKAED